MREITGYRIIDGRTGQQVGAVYSYANRNRAWARVDRLDNAHGSYRYSVQPIYGEA